MTELIVIGHDETGPRRGTRLLTLVADARRGRWIDATGEATVVRRFSPACRESLHARILQKVATV